MDIDDRIARMRGLLIGTAVGDAPACRRVVSPTDSAALSGALAAYAWFRHSGDYRRARRWGKEIFH